MCFPTVYSQINTLHREITLPWNEVVFIPCSILCYDLLMHKNKLWKLQGFIALLIYRSYSKDNHILYKYIPCTSLFESAVYTWHWSWEKKKICVVYPCEIFKSSSAFYMLNFRRHVKQHVTGSLFMHDRKLTFHQMLKCLFARAHTHIQTHTRWHYLSPKNVR